MANKIEIEKLDSLSANDAAAVLAINNNFTTIQEAINNTLSRDGTVPNFMDADIDLNTHRIINGGEPVEDLDYVTLKFFKENVGESAANAAAAELSAQRAASSAQSANISAQNAFNSAQSAANTVNGFDTHVEDKKTEFDGHVADKTAEFDTHAAQKQAQVDASANAAKQSEANAANSAAAAAKTASDFDAHAAEKVQEFDTNAQQKIDDYNSNATAKTSAFDTNAQHKLDSFNTNAAQKQAQVDASVEEARKWAIGSLQEQPAGSAKHWAEYAESITEGTLNETQITNCITKISHDIKLELVDGTLTLKAGSKVYYGNGDGTFSEYIIPIDLINSSRTTNLKELGFIRFDTKELEFLWLDSISSGDTAPTVTTQWWYWYDTVNKQAKYTNDNGASWINCSLPFGVVISNTSQWTSIDQVFNGFGYIGSTIFALPGVEGLIPNGRNADGSLNNVKFTTNSVLTINVPYARDGYLCIGSDGNLAVPRVSEIEYDNQRNYLLFNGGIYKACILARFSSDSSGRITSFSPKNMFQAVDRNDTDWASTASKPSGRYVDLTLRASGTGYTAPANGWVYFSKQSSAAGQSISLSSGAVIVRDFSITTTNALAVYLPVKKEKEFFVGYSAGGDTLDFRFVYDEGVK